MNAVEKMLHDCMIDISKHDSKFMAREKDHLDKMVEFYEENQYLPSKDFQILEFYHKRLSEDPR